MTAPDTQPAPEPPPLPARWRQRLPQLIRLERMALPLCVVLWLGAVLWRLVLGPMGALGDLDTQEAVVGLMARHQAEGGWPEVFVWGSQRMGALEPVPAAAAFALWGESLSTLRLVPFLATTLASLYALLMVARWLGGRAALGAALLAAVAFPAPTAVLVRALGGFSAGVLNGFLALGACAYLSLYRPRRLGFSAGLFCGLCMFTHPAMWAFTLGGMFSAMVGLGVVLLQPGRMLAGFNHAFRMAIGLAIGSMPLWLGPGLSNLRLTDEPGARELMAAGGPLGGYVHSALGSPWAVWGVGAVMLFAVPGILARFRRFGLDDAGGRLGLGALVTAVVSLAMAVNVANASPTDALMRAMPLVVCVPLLAAVAMATRVGAAGTLLSGTMLMGVVDPAALPASQELGAELPVDAVVRWLDNNPGVHCYTTASVAYRVALQSSERHRCVAITGPDHAREWRAEAAGGERAYIFAPEELFRLRLLVQDLEEMDRPHAETTAGPFFIVRTRGVAYPPKIPPVVWEHAKRERRAGIDANIDTGVTVRAGEPMRMELVWPTPVTHLSYWQDVTRLQTAPCSVRGGVVTRGKTEFATPLDLRRVCEVARRWALWPLPSLEVKVPLPTGREASEVLLDLADGRGSLHLTEVRVTPKELRTRLERE